MHELHLTGLTVWSIPQIQLPLPPKIDAAVSLMQVEEKPDVTYNDVGGSKEQIDKLREVSRVLFRTRLLTDLPCRW